MKAPKNYLSLTITLAIILFNVIDVKESQACSWLCSVADALETAFAGIGRSLQSPGMSLSIKLFIETIKFFRKL